MSHRVKPNLTYLGLFLLAVSGALYAGPTVAVAAEPVDVAGHWKGEVELPGTELGFNIDFTKKDGAWIGDISIPMQNAKNLPLVDVVVDGRNVTFKMQVPGDPTFKGTLSDDDETIAGDFAQGGVTATFSMSRGIDMAAAARERLAGFEEVVERALKDFMVPGLALGIVADDQVIWAKGFGYRDIENKKPVTPKTLLAIGSCTKAFTTFLLATLVDEGKLDWDSPVASYLPNFKLFDEYATAHLTPRDMVTHRSGLPRHDLAWYNKHDLSRADLVSRLRYFQPNKELRETFQYNNMMFLTAGYLAGQLTGGTWEDAAKERIFHCLGMTSTNFSVNDSQKTDDYALPYEEDDDEIKKMAFRNIDEVGPAGSINSNVEDMSRWMRVHLNEGKLGDEQILSAPALSELHTPQMVLARLPKDAEFSVGAYAMGWFVDAYRGHTRVQHGGNIDGFSALVTLYPRDGVGVVALANKNGTGVPELITRTIADRVFDLESKDWLGEALERRKLGKEVTKEAEKKKESRRIPDTRPTHPLTAYAGEYEQPGYGVLTIAQDGDKLVMTFNNIETPLMHWHYDVFKGLKNPDDATFENMEIKFTTNFKGVVDAVSAPFEPMVDEIVFSRRADSKLSDPAHLARFAGVYELAGDEITFEIQGDHLSLSAPGQPSFKLVPDVTGEFNLDGLAGFSVSFKEHDGAITAVLNQPNGVFELKRKKK